MGNTYSNSKLGTFQNCPRRFKFNYIEKIDVGDKTDANRLMGDLIHKELQRAYQLGADDVLYPLEDMLSRYRAAWEKPENSGIEVGSEYHTVEDYIGMGVKMLTEYYEKFQPFNESKLVGAEMWVRFTLPGTPFGFTGIVDRLSKRSDGVVEIVDYKTGKNFPRGPRDNAFFEQMALYQIGVKEEYPQFKKIEVVQYFLKFGEEIRYSIPEDELDEYIEAVRQKVLAIKQAEKLDNFPTQESALCSWCDYEKLCPARRHRYMLEAEEGQKTEEVATAELASEMAGRFIDLDARHKELGYEKDALRDELIRVAGQLGLEKIMGEKADLSIKGGLKREFPSKSKDNDSFVRLSQLAREWQLDECFALDVRALMKEYFEKGRLPEDKLTRLEEFVIEKISHTVRVVKPRKKEK